MMGRQSYAILSAIPIVSPGPVGSEDAARRENLIEMRR
jgi:hypothetical protein